MNEPRKRGRPRSTDTDPRTGRRGKVLAIQVDDELLSLVDWEVEALEALGFPVTRSDAIRAILARGAVELPAAIARQSGLEHIDRLISRRFELVARLQKKG
jgi:hypothetical protein